MTKFQSCLIFSFLLLISNCSYFIHLDKGENEDIKVKKYSRTLFCQDKSIQVVGENISLNNSFAKFIETYKHKFSALEFWAMLALKNLNVFPHIISPSSTIQVSKNESAKITYHEASGNGRTAIPYLKIIDHLLKKNRSKKTVYDLAKFMEKNFDFNPRVEEDLAAFLRQNSEYIKNDKALAKYYMRGNQTLKNQESLQLPKITKILGLFKMQSKDALIKTSDYLQEQKINNQKVICNFDISIYKNSLYLIRDTPLKSLYFGVQIGNISYMASVNQTLLPKSINDSPYFQTDGKNHMASYCQIMGKSKSMVLFSSFSRDPGQHIDHLIDHNILSSHSLGQVSSQIQFARYEIMGDPNRIFIESEKSDNSQLNKLLKLDFPFYHSTSLGSVLTWTQMGPDKRGLVFDHRSKGGIECR
jgi:hypothetical protein